MTDAPPHLTDPDRADYLAMLAELGVSQAAVEALSAHAADQIPLPPGFAVAVRPSPIAGLGVFVTQAFQAGQVVAPARIGTQRTPVGRYTNHAQRPTCCFTVGPDWLALVARRALAPGDEATVDYRASRQAAAQLDARLGVGAALVPVDPPGVPAARLRAQIGALEAALRQVPGAVVGDSDLCPLTHHFAAGVYVREMRLARGTLLVGKLHQYAHAVVLLAGEVLMVSEPTGPEHLRAPVLRIAPAGSKRAFLALQDSVWLTIHANPDETRDLAGLEDQIIAPSYAAFAAWQAAQQEEQP